MGSIALAIILSRAAGGAKWVFYDFTPVTLSWQFAVWGERPQQNIKKIVCCKCSYAVSFICAVSLINGVYMYIHAMI